MIRFPMAYRKENAPYQEITEKASELREEFLKNDAINFKKMVKNLGGSTVYDHDLGKTVKIKMTPFPIVINGMENSFVIPILRHSPISRDNIFMAYGVAGRLFTEAQEPHIVGMDVMRMTDRVNPIFYRDANLFLNELTMPESTFRLDFAEFFDTKRRNPETVALTLMSTKYNLQYWIVRNRAIELELVQGEPG